MERMNEADVKQSLKSVPDWSGNGGSTGSIQRTYQFKDFVESMKFVNAVAAAAEASQHHPDILIRWNKVTLTLSTHDAGGITPLDFALAAKSDALSLEQLDPKRGTGGKQKK